MCACTVVYLLGSQAWALQTHYAISCRFGKFHAVVQNQPLVLVRRQGVLWLPTALHMSTRTTNTNHLRTKIDASCNWLRI